MEDLKESSGVRSCVFEDAGLLATFFECNSGDSKWILWLVFHSCPVMGAPARSDLLIQMFSDVAVVFFGGAISSQDPGLETAR